MDQLFGNGKSWRGMDETGSASRLIAGLLAVVFVLVAMGLPSFASHGTSFEAEDGDIEVDATDDWANHTPTAVVDLPPGTSDDSYPGGTTPDTDPSTFSLGTGSIPNKDDLTKYNLVLRNIGSQDWLFLMWQRVTQTGAANVDFEFSQAPVSANNPNGLPPRTPGDKIIAYDFVQGGGSSVELSLLTWLAGPTGTCVANISPPCWGNRVVLNGVNHAVVNGANFLDGTETIKPGQFGEAGINLTSLTGLNTCLRANQIYVHTRSSTSFSNSTLKDIIMPRPIAFNNCPTVSGTKFHDDEADADLSNDSGAGLSGWTIKAFKEIGTTGIGDLSQAEYAAGAAATATTDPNGNYSFTLDFGDYVICEEMKSDTATWFQSYPASGAAECDGITTGANPGLGAQGHALNFSSGTNSTNNHFGNYQNSSISGRKFNDTDGLGSGTAGPDVTTPSFTINLYKDENRDGLLAGAELTRIATTSTSGGTYSFSGLTPGKYVVCEEPEGGWTQSSPSNTNCSAATTETNEDAGHAVTLLSGSPSISNNFGNFTKGTISGKKWEDGLADGLDTGLANNDAIPSTEFTIKLYKGLPSDPQPTGPPAFPLSQTTVSGVYSFTNLDPGTYTVCEEKGSSWTQSAPSNSACALATLADNGDNGGYSVTLDSGESESNKDFANFRLGSISGTKWNDLDNDGIDAGDPALLDPRHTIKLYTDTDKDGTLDAGEPEAKPEQLTSAANGTYSFTDVAPGSYIVCEVGIAGWTQTAPADTKCAEATTGNALDDKGHAVVVSSGQAVANKDFGNFQIPSGSISGWKYEDLDGDGAFDTGEPVVEGWSVTLYRDSNGNGALDGLEALTAVNSMTGPSTSGTAGLYVFTGLAPGKYIVCENAQLGTSTNWFQSGPTSGPPCSGTGFAAKGHSVTLLTHTSLSEDNNFFNYQGSSISGTKFDDDDGAGPGTTGAALASPSFTIHLYKDANRDGSLTLAELTPVATDTTDGNGDYSFTDLAPGDYVVCEAPEGSWTQSAPAANPSCQATSDEDGGHDVTLTSGSDETDKDFSNFTSATISGNKWEDGLADGLDTGLANNDTVPGTEFEIWLYVDADNDDVADGTQPTNWPKNTTTASGAYSFTVDPGSYVVCEEPDTWTQSGPSNSTCAGVDSSLGDGGHALTVKSGETSSDNDFANYRLGSIAGKKWSDLDQNGIDTGDIASPTQFTINLYEDKDGNGELDSDADPTKDETTVFKTTQTDGTTGQYSFSNLKPGYYIVCEEGISGWTQTAPTATACAVATPNQSNDNAGHAVTLLSGQNKTGKSFANFELPAGSVSGHKYHDLNGNGVLDSGEPPLQDWSISLYDDDLDDGALSIADIASVQTKTTDASGLFLFENVAAGNYLLCEDEDKSPTDTGWLQKAPAGPSGCSVVTSNADGGYDVTQATQRSISDDNDFLNYKQATIHVAKSTAPANANETFSFSGPAQDTDSINPSTTVNDRFSRTLDPGSYTWSEVAQDAWRLDSVTCTDSAQTDGKASLEDAANGSATFNVDSGDEVTCTFHNALRSASARAVKTTSPSTESKAGWSMKLTGPGAPSNGEVVVTDAQGVATFATKLQEGSYTIEEVNLPTGWQPPVYTDCTFTVDFPADDGDQFTCSVTNTKDAPPPPPPPPPPAQGTLIVQKQTLPDGATDTFSFSGALTATLGDGQSSSATVNAGTYTVSEATSEGWDLASITCTDSNATGQASTGDLTSRTATYRVEAGETVTCVFTNAAPPAQGRIVVTKQTLPDGSNESFEFAGALSGSLSDGESLSAEVDAGDYTVAELATDGWELSEISCTDSDPEGTRSTVNLRQRSATLRVDEGETVECTFTNLENEVLPKPPLKKPEPEILPKTVKTGVLPFTGSDPYALVGLAGLLIGTGGGLILVRRRKRH